MATMAHHLLAKTTTDEILNNFKTGSWTYGASGHGTNFLRTGTPADFPSPDAAFYDSVNKELAYFEFKPETETKRGILTGVGQGIAYLEKCNLSFLIAPKLLAGYDLESYLTDLYTHQLSAIPTGLIIYDNANPKNVRLVKNVTSLVGTAATPRTVTVERFWAKHQDLPIPLFHLILHYYYLKKVNHIGGDPFEIVNSKRGVWMITPEYAGRKSITREEVTENIKVTKLKDKTEKEVDTILQDGDSSNDGIDTIEDSEPWRAELAETLHSMNPYAFERLAMLLLRECGFSQVTVTKKSSDGGIDGTGKLRINGIFSFNVAFQCKRYTGSVSAGDIRDFRGSLTTDIEKGVFITTGSFTKAAREEASNAGKQQIDLIDGEEFISKLIEYGLGVKERTIYEVDKDFFERV